MWWRNMPYGIWYGCRSIHYHVCGTYWMTKCNHSCWGEIVHRQVVSGIWLSCINSLAGFVFWSFCVTVKTFSPVGSVKPNSLSLFPPPPPLSPCHRPNIVYVASNHFVWRLVPVSIASQIRQLLQDKQFELALQLAVSSPSQPHTDWLTD